jgi:hypothetical protein
MTKIVLIIGDDKLGHRAVADLLPRYPNVPIYLNRSRNPKRLYKIVRKNIGLLWYFIQLFWAEYRRTDTDIPSMSIIENSQDVLDMIAREKPGTVICFRAGLVFGKNLLGSGPRFLNLHYADLPLWGGLASLPRALNAKAYDQHACLHEMVLEIDGGDVLHRQFYRMDPKRTYRENEDVGFDAGLTLLRRVVSGELAL